MSKKKQGFDAKKFGKMVGEFCRDRIVEGERKSDARLSAIEQRLTEIEALAKAKQS